MRNTRRDYGIDIFQLSEITKSVKLLTKLKNFEVEAKPKTFRNIWMFLIIYQITLCSILAFEKPMCFAVYFFIILCLYNKIASYQKIIFIDLTKSVFDCIYA